MRALVVMAKAPIPGRVKTRLEPMLGPERAAELFGAFLDDVLERARGWAEAAQARAVLSWAGPGAPPASAAGFWVRDQGQGDLGQRIETARRSAEAETVVVLGSDAPMMADDRVAQAFGALETGQVVFGPTEDGGYDLVGFPGPAAWVLHDIPWSTPEVMEATRRRGAKAGARWCELGLGWDVDEPSDLERLATSPERFRAPRTAVLLRAWGLAS